MSPERDDGGEVASSAASSRSYEEGKAVLIIPHFFALMIGIPLIWRAEWSWEQVRNYERLPDHHPLPPGLQDTLYMIMVAAAVHFSWFVLSLCFRGVPCCWIFTAVLDLGAVAFLVVFMVRMARYIPTKPSDCSNKGYSDALGALFTYAADVYKQGQNQESQRNYDASWACNIYQIEWGGAIVVSYTTTVVAILGIMPLGKEDAIAAVAISFLPVTLVLLLFGALGAAAMFLWTKFRKLWPHIAPYVEPPLKWVFLVSTSPLWLLGCALWNAVPSVRYISRLRQKQTKRDGLGRSGLDVENSLDVVPLLPTTDLPNPLVCTHREHLICSFCQVQTCEECSTEINRLPETRPHFFCEPRCSRCYYKSMCNILPIKKSEPCPHRQHHCSKLQAPRACLSCSEKCSDEDLLRKLEEQEAAELRHLARHNVRCGVCETRLKPDGPRWWTCCDCNEECNSGFHPAWSTMKG